MHIVFNPKQSDHAPEFEFFRGPKVPCFETPVRFKIIRAAIESEDGAIEAARSFPDSPIRAIHEARYLDFLENAWAEWQTSGNEEDAFPCVWPIRGMRTELRPENFTVRLGASLKRLGRPTHFLLEGGYTVANVVACLKPFCQ